MRNESFARHESLERLKGTEPPLTAYECALQGVAAEAAGWDDVTELARDQVVARLAAGGPDDPDDDRRPLGHAFARAWLAGDELKRRWFAVQIELHGAVEERLRELESGLELAAWSGRVAAQVRLWAQVEGFWPDLAVLERAEPWFSVLAGRWRALRQALEVACPLPFALGVGWHRPDEVRAELGLEADVDVDEIRAALMGLERLQRLEREAPTRPPEHPANRWRVPYDIESNGTTVWVNHGGVMAARFTRKAGEVAEGPGEVATAWIIEPGQSWADWTAAVQHWLGLAVPFVHEPHPE